MKNRINLLLLFVLLCAIPVQAQRKKAKFSDTATVPGVSNGEPVLSYTLEQVDIHRRNLTAEERRAYYRLVYNIRKTYPYAVLAKERMDEFNAMREATERKKDERKYLKEAEKQIKEDFLEDLKNMTKSQGHILIKLLARQTDTTAYFLLKDFRGDAKAIAYQAMARLWGYNLKQGYDPEGEDLDIELIVHQIETGRIKAIAPQKSALEKNKRNKRKDAKKK